MMRPTILSACACALLSAWLPAQDGDKAPDAARIAELIEQLGAEDYADRTAAETALREIGEPSREALEKAAEEHDDPEVRWRARRVLRAQGGGGNGLKAREDRDATTAPPVDADLGPRIEDMFRQMEEAFGPDFGMLDEMREMLQRFEHFERRFSGGSGGAPFRWQFRNTPWPDQGGFLQTPGTGESVKIEMRPGKVRVEVREKGADGAEDARVYEAPDLETLRAQHPEVARRFFGGGEFGLRGFGLPDGQGGFWQVLPQAPQAPRSLEPVPAPPPAPGERLGVLVDPAGVAPAVREYLGLEPDQGLLVAEVQAGSLAEAAGIEPGDLVLAIAGRKVFGTEDVAAALRGIAAGSEVTVEVNRRGRNLELTATKAETAEEPAPSEATEGGEKSGDEGSSSSSKGEGRLKRR